MFDIVTTKSRKTFDIVTTKSPKTFDIVTTKSLKTFDIVTTKLRKTFDIVTTNHVKRLISWLQNPCFLNFDLGQTPFHTPWVLPYYYAITVFSYKQTKKQTFSNSNNTPCPRVLAAALKRFLSANPPTHFPCILPASAVAKLSLGLQVEESTYASSFLFCETVSHWHNNISPF